MHKYSLLGTCVLSILVGCYTDRESGSNGSVEKQSKDTEVDVSIVSDTEPTNAQKEQMLAAKEELFSKLSARLQTAIGGNGPAAAIAVCQSEALQIAADVSAQYGLKIGRAGVRLRNPKNAPPQWARSLTQAMTATPTFVTLSNNHVAALLPIKLQGQCLMCHGPAETIAPIIQNQLTRLYPRDEATGFHEGELRGWFWVEMPVEEEASF